MYYSVDPPLTVYTDYPLGNLFPFRSVIGPIQVELVYYDHNKYCEVLYNDVVYDVKLGYLFHNRELTRAVTHTELVGRQINKLSREYRLPKSDIREMLAIESGASTGDVVEHSDASYIVEG